MPTSKRRSATAHPTDFDAIEDSDAINEAHDATIESSSDSSGALGLEAARHWPANEFPAEPGEASRSRELVPQAPASQLPALLAPRGIVPAEADAGELPAWANGAHWADWARLHVSLPLRGLRPWIGWYQRGRDNAMLAASVWSWNTQPLQTLDELNALQDASRQQAQQLLQQWTQNWTSLLQHQRDLGQPNTLSKWTEEQFNLLGQAMELLSQQATDLANLDENLSVNFGYWAQQRLNRQLEAA